MNPDPTDDEKVWFNTYTFLSATEITQHLFLVSKYHLETSLTRLSTQPLRIGDEKKSISNYTINIIANSRNRKKQVVGGQKRRIFTARLVRMVPLLKTFTTTRIHKFAFVLPDYDLVPWNRQFIQLPKGIIDIPMNRYGKRVLILDTSDVTIRGVDPTSDDGTATSPSPNSSSSSISSKAAHLRETFVHDRELLRSRTEESKIPSGRSSMNSSSSSGGVSSNHHHPLRKTASTPERKHNEDVLVTPDRPTFASNETPKVTILNQDDNHNDNDNNNNNNETKEETKVVEEKQSEGSGGSATSAAEVKKRKKKGIRRSKLSSKTASKTTSNDTKQQETSTTKNSKTKTNKNLTNKNAKASITSSEWCTFLNGTIYIWSNAKNVRVVNLSLTNPHGHGMFLQESSTCTLAHVEIKNCSHDGLLTHGEFTQLTLIGCSIHHNAGCGIWAGKPSTYIYMYLSSNIKSSSSVFFLSESVVVM